MEHRFSHLFGSWDENSEEHPVDKWESWIVMRHPQLVDSMIDEIKRIEINEDELAGAFVAAGRAMIMSGTQFFFDTVTGVIYPSLSEPDIRKAEFPVNQVLYNIIEMRQRAHELVDTVFDQYIEEFKTENPEVGNEFEEEEEVDDPSWLDNQYEQNFYDEEDDE